MLIDCDTCAARGRECGGCVVTVLLGAPPEGVRLEDDERRAIEVLAASGLVPPLRLAQDQPTQVVEVPQVGRLGRASA